MCVEKDPSGLRMSAIDVRCSSLRVLSASLASSCRRASRSCSASTFASAALWLASAIPSSTSDSRACASVLTASITRCPDLHTKNVSARSKTAANMYTPNKRLFDLIAISTDDSEELVDWAAIVALCVAIVNRDCRLNDLEGFLQLGARKGPTLGPDGATRSATRTPPPRGVQRGNRRSPVCANGLGRKPYLVVLLRNPKVLARPAGFEPATLGLEGPVSDRLSIDGYHPRRLDGLDLANSRRFLPHFAVSSPHMR